VAGSVANITDVEPTISGVFVTEVADGATVEGVAESFTEMLIAENADDETVEFTTREVNGSEVTVIEGTGTDFPIVIEFGVVDDRLLVGVNEGIDNFIGEQTAPLADDATFQATLDALPSEVTSLNYLNIQSVLPLVEDAMALSASSSTLDNDPACAEFDTQEEAQAAYDEDDFENYNLDLDWDGEACEDFFATGATPEATPAGVSSINVLSVGSVTVNDGNSVGTHTIVLIGD
jgi:hypothetical protein